VTGFAPPFLIFSIFFRRLYSVVMKTSASVIGLTLLLVSLCCANSWTEDDSHYVSVGPRNGYYIVRPDSPLFHKLGLYDAPWIDTADRLRHGYGADALAFRFNGKGILIAPAAYIAQAEVSDFYMSRIGSLVRGRSTTHDVEAMFGHGHSVASRRDGVIYYYALPVYNPFEDWGGGRR
jgi:hypothetical protein